MPFAATSSSVRRWVAAWVKKWMRFSSDEHRPDRHGDAARIRADHEVRAPVGHQQPRVLDARGRPVLVVHKPDLDLAAEDAAGGIDLLHGHGRAHLDLAAVVGVRTGGRALHADLDRRDAELALRVRRQRQRSP